MNPIVIPCWTEEDWHRERTKAIGASEAAALVGCNPYLTPLQLWSNKKLALPATQQETERMEAGKFAELMCAPWYAKRTGREVVTPQSFYSLWAHSQGYSGALSYGEAEALSIACSRAFAIIVRHPTLPLQCTPDRIVLGLNRAPGVLQLKNADRFLLDEWEGADGKVDPPLHYQVQVTVEMLCTGLGWGSLAAVVGGNRLLHADIERHEAFCEKLGVLAAKFWASLTTDLAPAPTAADLESIGRQFPKSLPGLSKELERPELLMDYAREKALAKRHEERADALKAALELECGPAETLTVGGVKAATWKTQTRQDPPREARTVEFRSFRVDSKITKAAEANLPAHEPVAILPS